MTIGTLTILPDPARSAGGYAQLRLPAGSVSSDTVTVSIFDLYNDKFIGANDWQAVAEYFGPYTVTSLDSGEQVVSIGPEIVNRLEEFQQLRFNIGDYSAEATWPDVVRPSPRGPGGVIVQGQSDAKPTSTLNGSAPRAVEEQEVKPAPPPHEPIAPAQDEERKKPWLLFGLIAVGAIAAAAALAWFYLPVQTQSDDPEIPLAIVPACSADDALEAADGPRAALVSLLADQRDGRCTGEVTADTGLFMLRDAMAAGSAEALLLFGHLYNATITDPLLEDEMGIVLADDPAQALDYYFRAATAGEDAANPAITDICEAIADATDPLVAQARRDFCP